MKKQEPYNGMIAPLYFNRPVDGRHGYFAIMSKPLEAFMDQSIPAPHPLIAKVEFGRGQTTREDAERIADFVVLAANVYLK